jgi:hypothetical protein
MYVWRVDTLLTSGIFEGKTVPALTVTSTPNFEDASSLASNMVGIVKEINLLGFIPGIAPTITSGVKISIMYGAVMYKFPRTKDGSGYFVGPRKIITDWNERIDLEVGKAWKPELTIGPLPPQAGDPPEVGRLAALAALVSGQSMTQEFIEVISSEVFRGEVPTEDIRLIFLRDGSNFSTV